MDSFIHNENNMSPSSKAAKAEKSAGFRSLISAQHNSDSEKVGQDGRSIGRGDSCEKDVEVICDKGIVKSIKVTCSCGEVTEIDCQYPE